MCKKKFLMWGYPKFCTQNSIIEPHIPHYIISFYSSLLIWLNVAWTTVNTQVCAPSLFLLEEDPQIKRDTYTKEKN